MEIFRFVKKFLFKYKWKLIVFISSNLLVWGIGMARPLITGFYIDQLIQEKSVRVIYIFSGVILGIELMKVIIAYFAKILLVKVKSVSSFDVNVHVLEHVKRLPMSYISKHNPVYLNQRINSDSGNIVSFVMESIIGIMVNGLSFIFILGVLLQKNVKLTLILLSLIPIYLITYIYTRKPIFNSTFVLKEKMNKFFANMNEQIFNLKLIKINSTFQSEKKFLRKEFKSVLKSLIRYSRVTYLVNSCDSTIIGISKFFLFFFGGIEVLNGRLTVGDFTVLGSYFTMLLGTTGYFLGLGKSYQDSKVSYSRLNEILSIEPENNGEKIIDSINSIKLNNIDFQYSQEKKILTSFSCDFKKGRVYTIAGENGAGKSTLKDIIIGLTNGDYQGEVLYNDENIMELDMYSIRRKLVGIVEQQPMLVEGSVGRNLTYGLTNEEIEKVENWSRRLGIEKISKKREWEADQTIKSLSGGEKQRIALARTMIKEPDVIILDEPTSALDNESISEFMDLLGEIRENRITIIITHDDRIKKISDEVLTVR